MVNHISEYRDLKDWVGQLCIVFVLCVCANVCMTFPDGHLDVDIARPDRHLDVDMARPDRHLDVDMARPDIALSKTSACAHGPFGSSP